MPQLLMLILSGLDSLYDLHSHLGVCIEYGSGYYGRIIRKEICIQLLSVLWGEGQRKIKSFGLGPLFQWTESAGGQILNIFVWIQVVSPLCMLKVFKLLELCG